MNRGCFPPKVTCTWRSCRLRCGWLGRTRCRSLWWLGSGWSLRWLACWLCDADGFLCWGIAWRFRWGCWWEKKSNIATKLSHRIQWNSYWILKSSKFLFHGKESQKKRKNQWNPHTCHFATQMWKFLLLIEKAIDWNGRLSLFQSISFLIKNKEPMCIVSPCFITLVFPTLDCFTFSFCTSIKAATTSCSSNLSCVSAERIKFCCWSAGTCYISNKKRRWWNVFCVVWFGNKPASLHRISQEGQLHFKQKTNNHDLLVSIMMEIFENTRSCNNCWWRNRRMNTSEIHIDISNFLYKWVAGKNSWKS